MFTLLKSTGSWLKKAILLIVLTVLALNVSIGNASAAWSYSDVLALINKQLKNEHFASMVTGGDSLLGTNQSLPPKMMTVTITAYSSTPDQTDDTPFITASNTRVRDGIVAANFLPFGTKVKIPGIFGDKVFTVEDRMARKHDGKMDIWFPEKHLAKNFGIKEADVIILE